MANTIDTAFIKQFESDVHMAYQRMGSKLRNTVRTVGNVAGNVVRFQKIGTGSASTKSRNGMVTPMELAHTNVEATMSDFYAAEYIDKLDELKSSRNISEAIFGRFQELSLIHISEPTRLLSIAFAVLGLQKK